MPSAAAACLLFWGFAERGGDGLTADVLHTGLAGAWVVPSGLLLAVVLCTSASASRSCLGLGLCVPALGDALGCVAQLSAPWAAAHHAVSASCVFLAGGFVAAVAFLCVERERASWLLVAAGIACGALLAASVGLCWWWPLVGSGGAIRGRLEVSPLHVLAPGGHRRARRLNSRQLALFSAAFAATASSTVRAWAARSLEVRVRTTTLAAVRPKVPVTKDADPSMRARLSQV